MSDAAGQGDPDVPAVVAEARTRGCAPGLALVAAAALSGAVSGCAASTRHVQTQRYALAHPDFWQVKATAAGDGEATVVVIPRFGDAVIDEGSGALAPRGMNYEAVTADVEARVYAWPDSAPGDDPTGEVARLLLRDPALALPTHVRVPENPNECGLLPRKYVLFGQAQEPLDLARRPGWRAIVVGGRAGGALVGIVARVEFEQDAGRYCHNLRNLQVQLQNLLDGIAAKPPPSSPVIAPSPPPAAP